EKEMELNKARVSHDTMAKEREKSDLNIETKPLNPNAPIFVPRSKIIKDNNDSKDENKRKVGNEEEDCKVNRGNNTRDATADNVDRRRWNSYYKYQPLYFPEKWHQSNWV